MSTAGAENRGDARTERGAEQASSLLLVNEIQLLLSEKRTALSLMRTGIAVLALPLSVLSVLIATSRYYSATQVMHLLIPALTICVGLAILAGYLILRAVRRLHVLDQRIAILKQERPRFADLMGGNEGTKSEDGKCQGHSGQL